MSVAITCLRHIEYFFRNFIHFSYSHALSPAPTSTNTSPTTRVIHNHTPINRNRCCFSPGSILKLCRVTTVAAAAAASSPSVEELPHIPYFFTRWRRPLSFPFRCPDQFKRNLHHRCLQIGTFRVSLRYLECRIWNLIFPPSQVDHHQQEAFPLWRKLNW